MRIGVLAQWYPPEPGPARVPSVLAEGLRSRKHDLKVLTGFPNYPDGRIAAGYRQRLRSVEVTPSGIPIRRVPLVPSHDGRVVPRAANYLSFATSARLQIDGWLADRDAIWVYNSPPTVAALAAGLEKRRGVPFLLHIMDVWPDVLTESGMLASARTSRVVQRSLEGLVRRGTSRAGLVAVTSPGQIDLLASRGVPRELLRYQPVWADESVYFPRIVDRGVLPDRARGGKIVLMYAGAMGHVQRLDGVIRAAHAARRSGVELVLVGGGIAEPGLRQLAQQLGATNVHFMGRRSPDEMGTVLAAADAQLVTLGDSPLLRVTMPSKVQAIMASGRALIVSGAGDVAELVRDSGAGLAVAPNDAAGLSDAMEWLATQPEQVAAMGRSARRYYDAAFALPVAVARVEEMLASIT